MTGKAVTCSVTLLYKIFAIIHPGDCGFKWSLNVLAGLKTETLDAADGIKIIGFIAAFAIAALIRIWISKSFG